MLTASLVSTARAHASSGAWGDLCALLRARASETLASPELTNLLAEGLLRTGDARSAGEILSEALRTPSTRSDRVALRRATNLAGAAHFELGEFDEAEAIFESAIELAGHDGDDLLLARATHNLALIANIRSRHEDALARYRLAIPAYQKLGNVLAIAESYHNMARTYRDQRAFETADDYERRAIEFGRQAGNARVIASALVGRAEIALLGGDAQMAEATALHAAREFEQIPDPSRRADALRVCGVARTALGKRPEAELVLDEALSTARSCGATFIEAECLRSRAELAAAAGSLAEARQDARDALAIFTRAKADADRAALERWLDALG